MARKEAAGREDNRSGAPSELSFDARAQNDIHERLRSLAESSGFRAYALSICFRNTAWIVFHNYCEQFARRYVAGAHEFTDPVMAACRHEVKPVSWRLYERTDFYRDAVAVGLCDGLTAPAHGPGSLIVGATVAGRSLIGLDEAINVPARLTQLALETVQAVKVFRSREKSLSPTREQIEVVQLIASGMTVEQIAQKLGVTPVAIVKRVERAKDLLGARTQAQLIARAIFDGHLGYQLAP